MRKSSYNKLVGAALLTLAAMGNRVAVAVPPEPAAPPARPAADAPDDTPTPPAEFPAEIVVGNYLVLPKVGIYGRIPLHRDPIEAALVSGDWKRPEVGQTVEPASGVTQRWRTGIVNASGELTAQTAVGGYAFAVVDSPAAGVMLLHARGVACVYVNGRIHPGDAYSSGSVPQPVELRAGQNEVLLQIASPTLSVRFTKPAAPQLLELGQATLPDVVVDRDEKVWIGVPVVNAATMPLVGAKLRCEVAGAEPLDTTLDFLDRLSYELVACEINVPQETSSQVTCTLRLQDSAGKDLATATVVLTTVNANSAQRRTFLSEIDRSVQSYTLVPAQASTSDGDESLVTDHTNEHPAVLLALHNLGESADEFARRLPASPRWHIVAPTGRTAFGFDWEDWSASDIDQALADAQRVLKLQQPRIVGLGYASGGHGLLHWAVTHPGQLTAGVFVSAWPSLWTYGGGLPSYDNPTAVEEMLLRPSLASDTLALLGNVQACGTLLLHARDEASVAIEQSRQLLSALSSTSDDVAFRVVPGSGLAELDWDEVESFFAKRLDTAESAPARVSFQTANLSDLSTGDWVTIAQQSTPRKMSRVEVEQRVTPNSIVGTTENVARLRIDTSRLDDGKPFFVQLDRGRPVALRNPPDGDRLWLERDEQGQWAAVAGTQPGDKSALRTGGLKSVWRNRPLLVYGTGGSDADRAWAQAKAHYDAATFAYRGNGRLQVIPDTVWKDTDHEGRNVVLYGNADTNTVWPVLLSMSEVQVRNGQVLVDIRPEVADDLGVVLVQPRSGASDATVAVIGGTGAKGMQLTNRLRYFTAGIDYPDLLILGPDVLDRGTSDVRAAGYFDNKWKLEGADTAWRDMAF